LLNFLTPKIAWDSGGTEIMNGKWFGVTFLVLSAFGIALCCLLPPKASCQALPGGAIVPGDSVAGVKLGSSLADFSAVFPKHPEFDESMADDYCGGSSYHWLDTDFWVTGVYAYLRNDKIYQLRVQTPRFSLANGIKLDASEEKVKHLYPRGQAYVLRYSGSKVVGGRDLRYWVDSRSGTAFEFRWDGRYKRRFVGSIDIFTAGTEYKPEGCVAPPREWIYGELIPESKSSHPSEQRHFSAEVPGVDNPVAIPQDVLAVLKADEMVRNALESENIPAEKVPLSWFSAAIVHLSNSREADFVVMAKGTLAGGNVVTFWVFCATARGHVLVLTAPAHGLSVKNTRWRGHRDIELTSASAVQFSKVLCRFDGEKYAKYKTKSEPIR
jgi:hypothetical protein